MASFGYLWSNRAKPPFGSIQFVKAWAKRIKTLPSLLQRNFSRRKLQRNGAHVSATAEIGEAVFEGNYEYLVVGDFSTIGKAKIMIHDSLIVGNRVVINDNVNIITASHDVSSPSWTTISAPIVIEDYAWVGMNAIILPGVTIGSGAVVGAGAVVAKNVAPYTIVVGNPAKPVSRTRTQSLNYNPCALLASNRAWLTG